MRLRTVATVVLSIALAAATGCNRHGHGGDAGDPPGADSPVEAVRELTAHLIANDLAAFARDAVPPGLHARLEAAWREGRTRWPLDEFPLASHHPAALATLAADGAEQSLQDTFDRQFAGAAAELGQTAAALGVFGMQYIEQHEGFSPSERQHYAQIVSALSAWGIRAPLADRDRALKAIALLTAAAREAELTSPGDFAAAGMDEALARMAPVLAAGKQALALYGLDLDAGLSAMQVHLLSQTGDTAQVHMEYSLAGTPIDAVVGVERHDGRWYVSDFIANAEAALAPQSTDRTAD